MEDKIQHNKKLALIFFLVSLILLFFSIYGSIFAVLIALGFLARNSSWKKGISGEKEVTIALQELDDSYYLLNDVVLYPKHGNIDHIVFGPNGIFVIETKNYKGEVGCKEDEWYLLTYPPKKRGGGRRKRPVKKPVRSISKQAKRSATTLKNFLEKHIEESEFNIHSIDVTSVIVFVNPEIELKLQKQTVKVLQLSELSNFIRSAGTSCRFSDQELKRFGNIILKHSTE